MQGHRLRGFLFTWRLIRSCQCLKLALYLAVGELFLPGVEQIISDCLHKLNALVALPTDI